MLLYLVQHGEAKPAEEDPGRPLSPQGCSDIERGGAFLAGAGVRAPRIFHSGKTRAKQTAELLAASLGSSSVREADGLDPLAECTSWSGRLASARAATMLVGHLPPLAQLAGRLLCADETRQVVAFRMGSVVCLERDEAGAWSLRWMVVPDLLP